MASLVSPSQVSTQLSLSHLWETLGTGTAAVEGKQSDAAGSAEKRRDVTPDVPLTDDRQDHTAAVDVFVDVQRVVGIVLCCQLTDGQGRGGGVQDGVIWEEEHGWVDDVVNSLSWQ